MDKYAPRHEHKKHVRLELKSGSGILTSIEQSDIMHYVCNTSPRHAMSSAKTAVLPPVRVTADARRAVEEVLYEGESLSAFIEQSIELNVARRRAQDAFIARGLASRDDAKASRIYYDAESVMTDLDDILKQARDNHRQ
ncbi:YlcI/YnfO family protein [Leminorella grimontii]|uniref:YlcI/YnfO family protein n=1 Tax=Leminorella grimontii TaxID=82981 RepID=UPI00207F1034|nr:YlcI/YnfO family protein [Leminorella grimontii]GKX58947.1 hypothetical protein SOASR031_12620 [Leminorella grimontii]